MECEYCQKIFSNRGNLNYHQKTAKFCFKLREEKNLEKNLSIYKCEYCETDFTRLSVLQNHYLSCKKKNISNYREENQNLKKINQDLQNQVYYLTEKNKEYKEQNQNLQNQIKELATIAIEKPNKTINNNSNSNNKNIDNRTVNMVPFNLTQEKIVDILKNKFEEKHLLRGQAGLADFCLENILITPEKKFLYKCCDPSRNHFIFVDDEGKLQKDVDAKFLTHLIYEPARQKSREIYQECADRYFDNYEYNDENKDETESEDRLSFMSDKVLEINLLKSNNSKFIKGLIPPLLKKS